MDAIGMSGMKSVTDIFKVLGIRSAKHSIEIIVNILISENAK
jgi:hypothetical protein